MKVEPTPDRGVFRATSESEHNREWLVDLSANGGRGQCDCQHWQFRCSPLVSQGLRGAQTRCKHVDAARDKLAEMMGHDAGSTAGKEAVLKLIKKWVEMEQG